VGRTHDRERLTDGSASMSGHGRPADLRRLTAALALVGGFTVIEVVAGVWSGSLALLADGGHLLVDAVSLAAAILAARLASRPARGSWTFGFQRAEILSAAGNGVTLLVAAALVTVEAIRRLLHPSAVGGRTMVAVAAAGIVLNLAVAWVLLRADRSNLNVEGSLRHVLADLGAFLATLVAGVVVLATGSRQADSVASLLVALLMVDGGRRLLAKSGRVLLEAAPKSVDLATVRAHLLETPHVRDVHDLHVWTVTSDLPALSAHVVVADCCFRENHAPRILDDLQGCLVGHFDVDHSTFQLEAADHAAHEAGLHD